MTASAEWASSPPCSTSPRTHPPFCVRAQSPAYAATDAEAAIRLYDSLKESGAHPVLLFTRCGSRGFGDRNVISLGDGVDEYMHNIYAAMRTAEKAYDAIVIEALEGEGRAASVMNRVMKAVGGKKV